MPGKDLRSRYLQLLMDRLSETRYPSGPMMDRIEAAVADRASAEDYVSRLLDIIERDRYPSPQMLQRISRLVSTLDSH